MEMQLSYLSAILAATLPATKRKKKDSVFLLSFITYQQSHVIISEWS